MRPARSGTGLTSLASVWVGLFGFVTHLDSDASLRHLACNNAFVALHLSTT